MVLNQVGNEVGGNIIVPPRNTGYGSPINTEIHDGKADGESITFYVWKAATRWPKSCIRDHGRRADRLHPDGRTAFLQPKG